MVSQGFTVLIVTNSDHALQLVSRNSKHEIVNIKRLAESSLISSDLEEDWRAISARYGIDKSLNKFVELECVQNLPSYKSKQHVREYTVKLLKAYETLLESLQVNCFFQLLASDIERQAFSLAGKRFASHSIQYTQSVIPEKELIFVAHDAAADAVFMSEIERLQSPDKALSDRIKESMLDRKRSGRYLVRREWRLLSSFASVYAIKERILRTEKIEYFRRCLNRFFLVPLRKQLWKVFGRQFRPGEKYVFYPLHAPGEDTVIVRGFPHLDEIALIKIIAMSLPSGYKLYVKEHPGWEGWHTLCELSRLRDINEIRLIKSTTSSHDIILHGAGCVVLNSSVWFESLMLGKPVICLGTGIFTGLGVVREVYDLRTLDREIAAIIDVNPGREGLDRFLNVMWKLSYDGVYHHSQHRSDLTRKLFVALMSHLSTLEVLRRSQGLSPCVG
jgi:hypothetical protein